MMTTSENPFKVVTIFSCVNITPLGTPVEPLVYMIIAVSAALGITGSKKFIYISKYKYYIILDFTTEGEFLLFNLELNYLIK